MEQQKGEAVVCKDGAPRLLGALATVPGHEGSGAAGRCGQQLEVSAVPEGTPPPPLRLYEGASPVERLMRK